MFQTHDVSKRSSPFALPGEHFWGVVSFVLYQPWFHATFSVEDKNGNRFQRNIMLMNVAQLIELTQRDEMKLEFVDVVTPGYINGTERWRMEPLREVWLRKQEDDKNENHYEHVFILENGERYSNLAVPPIDRSSTNQLIFSW